MSVDLGTLKASPASSSPQSYTLSGSHLSSLARITPDGRLVVDLALLNGHQLPDLPKGYANEVREADVEIKPPAGPAEKDDSSSDWKDRVPPFNILILIVGSRGDVQPYLALALRLLTFGHRVRLATHGTFASFVRSASNGRVESFDIGGDPKELLAWMVKNPSLLPSFESMTNGDVGRKQKQLAEIMQGCFRATHEPDKTTGRRFAPDALLSNAPAFANVHLAEALGIPLQMTNPFPWSPTTSFPHPLVSIRSSNLPPGLTNVLSFALSENFTWLGLGEMTNKFRKEALGLEPLSLRSGPGVLDRLKIPWTYAWSPALIPKPEDWTNHIDIAGFYFLDLAKGYVPPPALAAFLAKKEDRPIVYIGFGSVPVSDPKAMSNAVHNAVKQCNVRALVSPGWAGLSGASHNKSGAADELKKEEDVFLLEDVPHDWLFTRVDAVVHHGGAGTTAIGLLNGLPTVICPWFGDQGWWGEMVAAAGAGPSPIPGRELTAEKLADGLKFALSPAAKTAARKMGEQIRAEDGVRTGVNSFHAHLPLRVMRCEVEPSLVAVWWSDALSLRLSALSAAVLASAGKLKLASLELHRSKEYDTRKPATDPITGGASEILRTVANYYKGIGTIFLNPPKGIIDTATAIPKGVLNIVQSIHEGFHQLPKAYGSSVRPTAKVTDFKSGLREGMKGLAMGYYDGITGLVSEPVAGGKQAGLLGAIKGAGRSYVNATVKPAAGIVGVVAHPASGAWRSIQALYAPVDSSTIRATRLADGADDLAACPPATRERIIKRFTELEKTTDERRRALEERARRFVEGHLREATAAASDKEAGHDGRGGSGGQPPRLTLADEEETTTDEDDDEAIRTPAEGQIKSGRGRASDEEADLLRRLAVAELRGYERGRQDKA